MPADEARSHAPSGNHTCGYGPDGMCDVCKRLAAERCTGGYTCWAEVHEHGCYSDHGDCTAPEEHVHA